MKKTDKNRKTGMKAAVLWAVFIFYLLFLVRVILFKQVRIDNLAAAFGSGLRSLNPIPFASIFEMLTSSGMSASRFIENVAGNLALFVPFGLMVPVLAELKANGKCMKEWERAPRRTERRTVERKKAVLSADCFDGNGVEPLF